MIEVLAQPVPDGDSDIGGELEVGAGTKVLVGYWTVSKSGERGYGTVIYISSGCVQLSHFFFILVISLSEGSWICQSIVWTRRSRFCNGQTLIVRSCTKQTWWLHSLGIQESCISLKRSLIRHSPVDMVISVSKLFGNGLIVNYYYGSLVNATLCQGQSRNIMFGEWIM